MNFDLLKAYNQEKKSKEKYQQNNLKNNNNIIFDNKCKDTQNEKKYYIKFIENKCSSGYFIDFNDKIININQKEREFINGDIFYYNIYDEEKLNEKTTLIKYKFYEVDFEEWNINENIPLFIYGKILEKKDDYIVILSHKSNNIIFIDDKENVFNNVKENKFYYFSFLKFIEEKQKNIYLKTTKFTLIKEDDENTVKKNIINEKILIKLNSIDYNENGNNIFNFVNFYDTEISDKRIDNNIIYFVYEKPDFSQEYFPQKIQLYNQQKFSSPIFSFFINKGSCNEINIQLNNKDGYSYDYYYYGNKNLPETIEIKLDGGKNFITDKLWSYGTRDRKKITFVNIPLQEGLRLDNTKSYFKIYTCNNKEEIKEYGTFLIDRLKLTKKRK